MNFLFLVGGLIAVASGHWMVLQCDNQGAVFGTYQPSGKKVSTWHYGSFHNYQAEFWYDLYPEDDITIACYNSGGQQGTGLGGNNPHALLFTFYCDNGESFSSGEMDGWWAHERLWTTVSKYSEPWKDHVVANHFASEAKWMVFNQGVAPLISINIDEICTWKGRFVSKPLFSDVGNIINYSSSPLTPDWNAWTNDDIWVMIESAFCATTFFIVFWVFVDKAVKKRKYQVVVGVDSEEEDAMIDEINVA